MSNAPVTTAEEFNEKYKDYLEDRHYGLDLHKPEAIAYLDNKFQEFIKIPGFKYSQIKSKFDYFCFYSTLTSVQEFEVENQLTKIYNETTTV
jgi:hypothetical protein